MKRTSKIIIGMLIFGLLAQLVAIIVLSTQMVQDEGLNNYIEIEYSSND